MLTATPASFAAHFFEDLKQNAVIGHLSYLQESFAVESGCRAPMKPAFIVSLENII